MSNEDQSRRGFLKGAGIMAGGLIGESVLPDAAAAQSGSRTTATPMSKGARFRAALSTGPFDEAARWRLPRDVSARVIDQADWLARAKRYGVVS